MGYCTTIRLNIDKGIAEAEAALRIDPLLPNGSLRPRHRVRDEGPGRAVAPGVPAGAGARIRTTSAAMLQLLDTGDAGSAGSTRRPTGDAGGSGSRGKRANDFYHLIVPLLSIRADAETRRLLEEAERRFPTFRACADAASPCSNCSRGRWTRRCRAPKELVARSPNDEEVKIHRADMAFLARLPGSRNRRSSR